MVVWGAEGLGGLGVWGAGVCGAGCLEGLGHPDHQPGLGLRGWGLWVWTLSLPDPQPGLRGLGGWESITKT